MADQSVQVRNRRDGLSFWDGFAFSRAGYWYLQGEKFFQRGSWPEAITYFRRCIKVANSTAAKPPECVFSWVLFRLGLALEQNSNYLGALGALQEAIAADPRNIDARMALGRVAVAQTDYDRAILEFKTTYVFIMDNRRDYSDFNADKLCSEVLNELGCAYMTAGNLTEAHRVLAQAVAANAENPAILANYAIAAGEVGESGTLRKYLNRALEKDQTANSPLISALIQEAAAVGCGDIILDVLRANGRISYHDYERQQNARQRNPRQHGSGMETVRIERMEGLIVTGSGDSHVGQRDSYNFHAPVASSNFASGANATQRATNSVPDPDSLRMLVNMIRGALPSLEMDMYVTSDMERATDQVARQSNQQDPDKTRLGASLGKIRALLARAGNLALSVVLTTVIDQELARLGLPPAN